MCFPAHSAVLLSFPEEQLGWKAEPDYEAMLLLTFSSWHVVESGLAVFIPIISPSTRLLKS